MYYVFKVLTLLAVAANMIGCASLRPSIEPENNFAFTPQSDLQKPRNPESGKSVERLERLLWYRAEAIYCADTALARGHLLQGTCRGKLNVFLESAITESNEACRLWFDWLIKSDVETTYAKNWFNIVGNSAQALMGLTGDSPTQIAKVALALGFGNSGFDNYRAVYLMTSTLGKVQTKIDEGRKTAADAIRTNLGSYKSWDDANEDIQSYHRSCSRKSIQEIVEAGVDATTYELVAADATEVEYQNANQRLFKSVYGTDGQFPQSEMIQLDKNSSAILAAMPAAAAGLLLNAQTAFAKLTDKDKSVFRRWLETAHEYLAKQATKQKKAAEREATKDAAEAAVIAKQDAQDKAASATSEVRVAKKDASDAQSYNKTTLEKQAAALEQKEALAHNAAAQAAIKADDALKAYDLSASSSITPYAGDKKAKINFQAVTGSKRSSK